MSWNADFHWRSPRDGEFINMPDLSPVWGDHAFEEDPASTGNLYPNPVDETLNALRNDKLAFAPDAIGADGSWSPERRALHDKIITDALEGVVPTGNQPRLLSLGGGPGSGKSSMRYGGGAGAMIGAPPTRYINAEGAYEFPEGGVTPAAVRDAPDTSHAVIKPGMSAAGSRLKKMTREVGDERRLEPVERAGVERVQSVRPIESAVRTRRSS